MIAHFKREIIGWAHDRNIIEGSTPVAQFAKLVEELGEMSIDPEDAIGDATVVAYIIAGQLNYPIEELMAMPKKFTKPIDNAVQILGELAGKLARGKDAKEELSEVFGLIRAISDKQASACGVEEAAFDLFYQTCVGVAYNEIKNRKGRMVDGVFVKEADL